MSDPHEVVDWDDMSEEDKQYAQDLLKELNLLFDKYTERDDPCEDSTLKD